MSKEESPTSAPPIFILGLMPRSGSNYLAHLLRLHSDCVEARMSEDFILEKADRLIDYVHLTSAHWQPEWDKGEKKAADLLQECLGQGMISFLQAGEKNKRTVAKTPSVHNLEHFFKFFPHAYLLIIVRDGRSVVESGMRSFGWNFEWASQRWVLAARSIQSFEVSTDHERHHYRIVRYEDLWLNIKPTMEGILNFLGLDRSRYDFEAAANLPVRGSSQLACGGEGELHWKATEKTGEFNPMDRWEGWSRVRHERFNWLAGKELANFNYEPKRFAGRNWIGPLGNNLMDLKWGIRDFLKRMLRHTRNQDHESP